MVKQDMIEYLRDSNGQIILATYLGKPIFMDDGLVYGNGRYISLILVMVHLVMERELQLLQ